MEWVPICIVGLTGYCLGLKLETNSAVAQALYVVIIVQSFTIFQREW
jgi:hypothetical protein